MPWGWPLNPWPVTLRLRGPVPPTSHTAQEQAPERASQRAGQMSLLFLPRSVLPQGRGAPRRLQGRGGPHSVLSATPPSPVRREQGRGEGDLPSSPGSEARSGSPRGYRGGGLTGTLRSRHAGPHPATGVLVRRGRSGGRHAGGAPRDRRGGAAVPVGARPSKGRGGGVPWVWPRVAPCHGGPGKLAPPRFESELQPRPAV